MKLSRKAGATSQIFQIFIADSSSTTGAGLIGLTNASSGLTAYYHRDTDTTATAISLVTMTVGTFTSSGFKEIDATNMPGWYQFCPPNAALASGASSCAFHLKGATNMAPLPIEVDLDSQVDVTHWNGTAVKSPTTAGVPEVCMTDAVSHGGTLGSSTATLALSRLSVVSQSSNTNALTVTGNGTGHGGAFTSGSGATGNGLTLLAASTNGHGLKSTGTGTGDGAELTAGASGADLDADITGSITGSLSGSVGSVSGAVGSVTGNVGGNVTGSIGSLTNTAKTNVEDAVWNATMASHVTGGTTGAFLNASGSASDPLLNAVPGSYAAGTAGYVLGTNLDATVSSRLPTSSYTAPDNTNIGLIKAKTDNLTFTTASKVDAKLTSDGLDNISATAPTAVATTFKDKILQIWERLFGRVKKDDNAGTIEVFQGTGSTPQTTQTFTSSGGIDTINRAT